MGLDDERFEVPLDVAPRERLKIVDVMILIAVCACYFAVIGNALRSMPTGLEVHVTGAVVIAVVARYKGRVWWRWLVAGIFLGPIALLMLSTSLRPRLRPMRTSPDLGPELNDDGEPQQAWDEVDEPVLMLDVVNLVDVMLLCVVVPTFAWLLMTLPRPMWPALIMGSALCGAFIAIRKRRDWWRGFVVGFLGGPIGLVLMFFSPRLRVLRTWLTSGPKLNDEGRAQPDWDEVDDWPQPPSLIQPRP